MSGDDAEPRAEAFLQTLEGQAQTLVRSPSSTVAPPRDGLVGRRAREVLQGLLFDPKALIDEGPLGQGGMGVVRLAKQVALDRRVAVKSLRPEHREAQDVEALLSEAWLAGALEHPNILPVYSVGLDEQGLPLIVMKRIEGRTWSTLLSDAAAMARHAPDKAPLDEHLRILQQVCHAVHFAHTRGVVHRDLKPDNVMVGEFGEVYVVDWGIATRPGSSVQLAGTPAYMAPEMLGGPQAVISERTDVYLLGAMLFEVLAGRPPHRGVTPNELIDQVLRSNPPFPSGVAEELAEVVRGCMRPKPGDRPESALAVRRLLEAFLEHQGSLALATQSERRAEDLRALLATPAPDLTRVYGLFSECRFGFQQALSAWSHNARARSGLDGALGAMIRFELQHGSVKAARALWNELGSADPTLSAELDAASLREAEQVQRLAELKALERDLDPLTGSSPRVLVALAIGLIWVISPFLGKLLLPRYAAVETLATAPSALISALLLVAVALRSKADRTKLNRQLLSIVVSGMLVQVAFVIGSYLAVGDLGPRGVPLLAAYWFVLSGVVSVALLPSVWPSTLAYLLAAIGAFAFPEARFEIAVGSNAVFCINMAFIFRRQRGDVRARGGAE